MIDLALPCISLLITVSPLENQQVHPSPKGLIRDAQLEPHPRIQKSSHSSQCWWDDGSCLPWPCSSVKQIHTSRILCSVSCTQLKMEVLSIYWSYSPALLREGNLTLNSQELVITWSADSRKITPTRRAASAFLLSAGNWITQDRKPSEHFSVTHLAKAEFGDSRAQCKEHRIELNYLNSHWSLIMNISGFLKAQVVAMPLSTW